MSRDQLYEQSNLAAHKELLKEDLALRISEAINSAGVLFDSFVFAPMQEIEAAGNMDKTINELYSQRAHCKNSLIKGEITKQITALEAQDNPIKETHKIIDITAYRTFIINFYNVWLESKDQIASDEGLIELFEQAKRGNANPRKALECFEHYLSQLEQCGIMKFTYYTGYKKGEKHRGGI